MDKKMNQEREAKYETKVHDQTSCWCFKVGEAGRVTIPFDNHKTHNK